MKKLLGIVVLVLLLSGCANQNQSLKKNDGFAIGSEMLSITSFPSESKCELKNDKGAWNVVTPATVKIKRSKSPLVVSCIKNDFKKVEIFDFKSQNEIKGILDNPVESLSGGAIGVAAGFFKAANESVGSYGTTRNADGVATIYLMLK